MLRYKGIDHERVDLMPGSQRLLLRLHGFRGGTVPALTVDGRKVEGTLQVSRTLDELQPEPRLFPADPAQRAAVEEAERWGEAVLQPVPRNIFRWGVARDGELRRRLLEMTAMPLPAPATTLMKPVALIDSRPAGELAMRIAPSFGSPMPIALPANWVPQPARLGAA